MKNKNGSFTVEAALVLPVFFFAMMLCVFIIQLLICQDEVQWALTRIARETSVEMATVENDAMKKPAYFMGKMALYVKGSGLSISMSESKVEADEIDLAARYSVNLPFQIFTVKKVHLFQRVRTRAFVGVESRAGEEPDDRMVYVAETGRVYHLIKECTYLKLSISQVLFGDIGEMRNESGGKYKPCDGCAENKTLSEGVRVYITNYGNRFHTIRTCSHMKRTIYEMKLSEAGKRPACSKCGR